MEVWFVL